MNNENKPPAQVLQLVPNTSVAPVMPLTQCEQLAQDLIAARLHLAEQLVREAWRLLDGQDPATIGWHRAAAVYLRHSKEVVHSDTERLDLYERQNKHEFGLVPYYDDALNKWFLPPADDDLSDGQTFDTLRAALDWMMSEGMTNEQ
ncbi:hypothetical protein [Pseudomonas atacamensis]|uniref:hypothetical protein n=1 Tax=Pseudomonas atacamensis TaxID=2565368 RepID=UPI0019D156E3|nr:hypothetical protein [Pseudomonas atacamensis]QSL90483.1 hypothetical protein JWU58_26965 [Pseudomonas atacamensis]